MLLKDYLAEYGIEKKIFAEQNGFSENSVVSWCLGKHLPLLIYRQKIQKVTNNLVTLKDWRKIERKQPEAKTNRYNTGLKNNGLHSTKCVRNDRQTQPKSNKKKRKDNDMPAVD